MYILPIFFFLFRFLLFFFCSGNKSTIPIKLKSINGCTLEMCFVSYLNKFLLSKNALVYIVFVFVFFVTTIKNTLISFPFYSISFITLEVISIVSLWKETEFTSLIYTGTGNIMSVVELVQRSTFTIILLVCLFLHLLAFHWTVVFLVLCLLGSHYDSNMEFQSISFFHFMIISLIRCLIVWVKLLHINC